MESADIKAALVKYADMAKSYLEFCGPETADASVLLSIESLITKGRLGTNSEGELVIITGAIMYGWKCMRERLEADALDKTE
jgi:hypothetical protein